MSWPEGYINTWLLGLAVPFRVWKWLMHQGRFFLKKARHVPTLPIGLSQWYNTIELRTGILLWCINHLFILDACGDLWLYPALTHGNIKYLNRFVWNPSSIKLLLLFAFKRFLEREGWKQTSWKSTHIQMVQIIPAQLLFFNQIERPLRDNLHMQKTQRKTHTCRPSGIILLPNGDREKLTV